MESERGGLWPAVSVAAVVALSAPLLISAVLLGWQAVCLPAKAGNLARAELWQAANFTLGLAIGAAGSVAALAARSLAARKLGAAGTMMGITFVLMGFMVARFLTGAALSQGLSALPLLVPMPTAFASLVLLVEAARLEKKPTHAPTGPITEEPRPPLSQP